MKLSTAIAMSLAAIFLVLCWILIPEAKASQSPDIEIEELGYEADYLKAVFICVQEPGEYTFIFLPACVTEVDK